jgi:hypothetical protein
MLQKTYKDLQPFLIYCAPPSDFIHPWFVHKCSLVAWETSSSEAGKNEKCHWI